MVRKLLVILISISLFSFTYANSYIWSDAQETMATIPNKVDLKLDVESAVLMDEDTGTILYTKN